MGTFLFLAEAHSEVEGGFGFSFDILESNLINLAILGWVIFYYGRQVIANIMGERRSKIAQQIQEVEQKQKKAAEALVEQQQKLAKAQMTAEEIRATAQVNAQKAKEAILAQGEKEVERLKAMAMQDLNSEQEKAISELRQRVSALALERVESQLYEVLDDSAQQKLIERSIAQLGGS